jgi:hypothetical protein
MRVPNTMSKMTCTHVVSRELGVTATTLSGWRDVAAWRALSRLPRSGRISAH